VGHRRPDQRGFTILELLVAMSMFAILGIAVVSLLGQGLNLFTSGTADTTMQDRIQAILPVIREDFAAIQPAESPEVLPPPPPEGAELPPPAPDDPTQVVEGPRSRLIADTFKLKNLGSDRASDCYYVGFVRSNAREGEDSILRNAGSTPAGNGVELKAYDPSTVESGTTGNLLATGGLQEIVYVAIPDDPDMPGMLTLYRLFRAPAGGPKSLLAVVGGLPVNFDSVEKIRAAGRPVLEGVLHFGVTFRNVFATSWNDGDGKKFTDGSPYVGPVWDSTRANHPIFMTPDGKKSLGDVKDDVFPAMARIDLTLAVEGPYGFNRGEALLAAPMPLDERRATLTDVEPLFRPGPRERFLKIDAEWMSVTAEATDFAEKRVTVGRGKRLTKAVEHRVDEPVYFGYPVTTDVTLLFKDRYARR
jgi:prepilin-type N-terminal cleavage/methylation domain-containing protein